jgi:hypothetical protein
MVVAIGVWGVGTVAPDDDAFRGNGSFTLNGNNATATINQACVNSVVTQSELATSRAAVATMEADVRTKEAELRQYQEEEARLSPVRPGRSGSPSCRQA